MTAQLPSRKRLAEIHKLAAKSDKYIYHLRADEVEAMTRALLAAHEQEPVAVVEPSDYVTAAQISDDKPRKIAVRELYEGALVIGQSLYENPAPSMHLAAQKHASGDRPAVWVRLGDSNHAPDCTLDHDEAREWEARGLEVLRMVAPAPAPVPVVPDEVPEWLKDKLVTICDMVEDNDEYCQDIWNACRAAMLNGADVTLTYEGKNHYEDNLDWLTIPVVPPKW